jgi:hypothetical protein
MIVYMFHRLKKSWDMKAAVAVILTLGVMSVLALGGLTQGLDSASIVQTALDLTDQQCVGLSRNEACYGHARLFANPRPNANPFVFEAAGDVEGLAKIQSLRLSGLDLEAGTWGVALMRLRANLTADTRENVTLVAFGDVELDNAVLPPTEVEAAVNTREYINVRLAPTVQAGPAGALAPNQAVTAVERLADTSWVRVLLPDTDATGWVRSDLLTTQADFEQLNVTARDALYHQPMQAFYFRSGQDRFTAVPESGLLIQTPEGVGEVQLLINEVNIQLGSTVYFRALPGGDMVVSTLEGHADVRANNVMFTAYAGTEVHVPLTADLQPAGPPRPPQPYDAASLEMLPLRLLPRAITVSPALTWDEVNRLLMRDAVLMGDPTAVCCPTDSANTDRSTVADPDCVDCDGLFDGTVGAVTSDEGGRPDCPGKSCEAPGLNKDEGSTAATGHGQNKDKDDDDD